MRDLGFGNVPSGRPLAERLAGPLAERELLDVPPTTAPPAGEPDQPQGRAESGSGEPAQAAAAGPLQQQIFGGLEWAITGQVAIVEIPRLVQGFEADLMPFIERIKQIDRPRLILLAEVLADDARHLTVLGGGRAA